MTDQKKTKAQLVGEVTALRQKVAELEEKTKLQQQSTRNFRRLFESEREQRQEIERLQQAGIVLHSSLNFETVLDYILEQVAQFITYDAACLMLVHEGNVRVVRWYGYARRGTAPGFALKTFNISDVPELEAMDSSGEPWLVPDASKYNPWIHGHGTRWVKSHLSAPIRIRGTLTGIIQLDSASPNFFNPNHATMLSRFIYQAAIAVGNAQLYDNVRQEINQRFRAVKSERNFVSAILNTESALVLVLNPGGRVLRANKTYEQNIGYAIDEIRGKPIWDLPLAPGESQKLKTVFKRVQANQSSVELEIRWRTKSDQQRVISWAVNVLLNNLGKVDFVIFTGVDITGQKQLEERLLAIHHLGRELNLLRDEVEICTIALETTSFLLNIKSAGYGLLQQASGKLEYHYYPKRGVPKTVELSLPVDTDKRITALKRQRRSSNGRDETGKLSLQRLPSPGWLTAFMQVKDRIIGVLDVESFDPYQFSADDRQLLQTLADQTAVAIENARLYHETRKRVEELTTLSLISQAVTSTLDLEETLTLIINHTIRVIDAEAASVVLSDDDKKELVFQAASGGIANQIHGMRMPAGQGIVGWVVEHGQSALAPDVANDPRFLNALDQMTGFTTQSILCVPLQSGEKVFGAIEVVNKRHGTFTAQDLQLLSWLATPASIAIDNARLFQAEHTARQQAERLQAATATLTSTLKLDQVLNEILVQLESVIPCDNAYVFLQDEDWLKVVAWRGISTENREVMGSRYPVKSLFFQEIKNTGYPVILDDARTDPRFVGWMNNKYARGWMGVPLMAQKTVIGCLTLDSQNLAAFTHADAALAKAFANQATVAIQNARLFEEVQTSHAQLEQLSQRLVEVQETERRRIARELHDEAGQALTSLMIGLHVLEKDADDRQSVLTRVSELKNLTKDISEDLHRLAMDLRPASLDYLGLAATLGQLVTKFNQQYEITAKFEAVELDQERLPATIETNLYRVVQEALTNVVRHAQATNVDILIERRVGKIVVVVEDNGKGFDPEEAGRKKRLGLLGIRERIKMLDGTLRVESSPTAGTTINVEVPYVNSNSNS